MNQSLIDNWNEVVKEEDLIFILGDFCFDQKSQWVKFLKQLKGKKYLIQGNHDRPQAIPHEMLEMVCDMLHLWIYDENTDKYDQFFLCHYPILSYPGMFRGCNQLFGHCHSREHNTGADAGFLQHLIRSYDVGVDGNNFTPVSIQRIREIFKNMKECSQ